METAGEVGVQGVLSLQVARPGAADHQEGEGGGGQPDTEPHGHLPPVDQGELGGVQDRGGVGTQVVHSRVKRPLELSSLYDDLAAAGQRPTTKVLVNTVVPATAELAAALGVTEGTDVHRVERLRLAHGEPIAYLINHLPPGLLDLDTAQLEATGLYRLLRTAGITLHSARQSIGARGATAMEAERLGEADGAPLLTMCRTTYDDTGRTVEYGDHTYRPSRYAFEFQLLVRP